MECELKIGKLKHSNVSRNDDREYGIDVLLLFSIRYFDSQQEKGTKTDTHVN